MRVHTRRGNMIRVRISRKRNEKHRDKKEKENNGNLNREIFGLQGISKI